MNVVAIPIIESNGVQGTRHSSMTARDRDVGGTTDRSSLRAH